MLIRKLGGKIKIMVGTYVTTKTFKTPFGLANVMTHFFFYTLLEILMGNDELIVESYNTFNPKFYGQY